MSFSSLGLLPSLVDSLARMGIVEPSPVQRVAVPAIAGGASVVVVARTGSGKTVAYGAPVLQRLRAIEDAEGSVTARARPRALVLTGTRELVEQSMKALKGVAHGVKQRVRAVSGGMGERDMGQRLKVPVDLLVSNPPRLRAVVDAGVVSLDDVRVLVLDEADTLCAPGQRPDVEALLRKLPAGCQLVLVSATLPEPIRHWVLTLPQAPTLLLSRDAHSAPESVKVTNHSIRASERADAAHDILVALPAEWRGILFANRRETADEAGKELTERGHSVVVIHGGQLPRERRAQMAAFRAGQGRVLVTTELGGRGLHLDGLVFVLNYELPEKASEYLHRMGRVGRQGAKGAVHNLVTSGDAALLKQVERLAHGGKLDTGETQRAPRSRPEGPAKAGAKSGERRGERSERPVKRRPARPKSGERPARAAGRAAPRSDDRAPRAVETAARAAARDGAAGSGGGKASAGKAGGGAKAGGKTGGAARPGGPRTEAGGRGRRGNGVTPKGAPKGGRGKGR